MAKCSKFLLLAVAVATGAHAGPLGNLLKGPASGAAPAPDPVHDFMKAAQSLKDAEAFVGNLTLKMKQGMTPTMPKTPTELATAALGGVAAFKVGHFVHTQLKVREAECAFNSVLASQYVARAGLHITAMTKTCRPGPSYLGPACNENIAGIFASVGLIAAYISLAASQCGNLANIEALCAGSVWVLIAGLAKVASAAEVLHGTCAGEAGLGEENAMWQLDRRLEEVSPPFETEPLGAPPSPADEGFRVTTCVLDVTTVAASLGQFSLAFKETVVNCGLDGLTRGTPILGPVIRDVCIARVGEMIYAFGTAAQFIAAAVSHCGNHLQLNSLCLAAAEEFVATAGGLVFVGGAMDATCVRLPKIAPLGKVIVPLTAIGRRLNEVKGDYRNMSKAESLAAGRLLLGLDEDLEKKVADASAGGGRDSLLI